MHVGRLFPLDNVDDRPMCLPTIPQAGRATNEAAQFAFSRLKERFGVPFGTLGICRKGHSTYNAVQLETE